MGDLFSEETVFPKVGSLDELDLTDPPAEPVEPEECCRPVTILEVVAPAPATEAALAPVADAGDVPCGVGTAEASGTPHGDTLNCTTGLMGLVAIGAKNGSINGFCTAV